MDIHSLKKRFEIWKHIFFINLGASIVLFLQALLGYLESQNLNFEASWYAVWFLVQLASLLPGFVLLFGKHWMRIPLRERLNTIFGYFVVAWFTLLPVGIRIDRYSEKSFNYFLFGGAVAIAFGYWWLHRKSIEVQNEMFP